MQERKGRREEKQTTGTGARARTCNKQASKHPRGLRSKRKTWLEPQAEGEGLSPVDNQRDKAAALSWQESWREVGGGAGRGDASQP